MQKSKKESLAGAPKPFGFIRGFGFFMKYFLQKLMLTAIIHHKIRLQKV